MFCRGTKERSAGVAGSKIAAVSKRSLGGRISGPVEEPTARRRLTKPGRDESQGHRLGSRFHTAALGPAEAAPKQQGSGASFAAVAGQDVNGTALPGPEVGISRWVSGTSNLLGEAWAVVTPRPSVRR